MNLTKDLRETIILALLKHRFEAEASTLMDQTAAFAEEVRIAAFGGKVAVDTAESLPRHWLRKSSYIGFVEARGYKGDLQFSGWFQTGIGNYATFSRNGVIRCVPFESPVNYPDSTKKLVAQFEHLCSLQDKLREQIRTARTRASATLDTVRTDKALLKIWPEVEPFIPKDPTTAVQLPAIPIHDLNQLLELPVT